MLTVTPMPRRGFSQKTIYTIAGFFISDAPMDFLERMKLALEDVYVVLFNEWLWIIIGISIAIMITPMVIIVALFYLPPYLAAVAVTLIAIGWGIAGGYKEWASHKQREEEVKIAQAE